MTHPGVVHGLAHDDLSIRCIESYRVTSRTTTQYTITKMGKGYTSTHMQGHSTGLRLKDAAQAHLVAVMVTGPITRTKKRNLQKRGMRPRVGKKLFARR
jgi:hypothetical protein